MKLKKTISWVLFKDYFENACDNVNWDFSCNIIMVKKGFSYK
jgi:hypothetical protein